MRRALPEVALEGDLESKERGKEGIYLYAGHGMDMGWTGKMFKCQGQFKG